MNSAVTCHAAGDRCLGCKHYRGLADRCEFAPRPCIGCDGSGWLGWQPPLGGPCKTCNGAGTAYPGNAVASHEGKST